MIDCLLLICVSFNPNFKNNLKKSIKILNYTHIFAQIICSYKLEVFVYLLSIFSLEWNSIIIYLNITSSEYVLLILISKNASNTLWLKSKSEKLQGINKFVSYNYGFGISI